MQHKINLKMKKKLYNKIFKLHPYLDPKYIQDSNPSRSFILNFENQHFPINFPHHIFNDIFETPTFNKEPN
jgi:hypothetical protein